MLRFVLLGAVAALTALAAEMGTAIDTAVRKFQSANPGTKIWIYAKNIETGATYALNEQEKVRTASTIKLPIMVAAFKAVADGKAKWTDRMVMKADDKVSGSGVIRELDDNIKLSLRDLVRMMIVVSDNTATNLVLDRIGAEFVNQTMDGLGYPDTRAMRKVLGDGRNLKPTPSGFSKAGTMPENKRFGLGSSTPKDMVSLLERIDKGTVVSAAASKEMIAILKRQQFMDGIGRRASDPVASKSGTLDALRSDVGIVYSKAGGRIAMAITVDGLPHVDYSADNVGNLLISELAGLLVRGLATK